MAAATGDRWLLADTLAIVAAIFSLFCRRTIATRMRALSNFLLCHRTHLAFLSVLTSIRPTALEINPGPPSRRPNPRPTCHAISETSGLEFVRLSPRPPSTLTPAGRQAISSVLALLREVIS